MYKFRQFHRKCRIDLRSYSNQQSNRIRLSENTFKFCSTVCLSPKNYTLTLQIPAMHISFVPILHGVPSVAESPHGTMTVSSESVQYNLQGSSMCTKKKEKIKNHCFTYSNKLIITTIKIGQPLVLLFTKCFAIVARTLLCSKTRFILIAQFLIADFITNPFANTKRSAVCRCRMVTLSALCRYSAATSTWAFTPIVPIAPATVNRCRLLFDRYTLLMLAPLKNWKKIVPINCKKCSSTTKKPIPQR